MTPDEKDKLTSVLEAHVPPGHAFVMLIRPTAGGTTETLQNINNKATLADWLRHCARGFERMK